MDCGSPIGRLAALENDQPTGPLSGPKLTNSLTIQPLRCPRRRVAKPKTASSSARVGDGGSPTSERNVTSPEKFNSASLSSGEIRVDKPILELWK